MQKNAGIFGQIFWAFYSHALRKMLRNRPKGEQKSLNVLHIHHFNSTHIVNAVVISFIVLLNLYIWRQILENSAKIGMTCKNRKSNEDIISFQGPHRLVTNLILKKYINFDKAELITFLKDVPIKIMYKNETDRNFPPDRNMTPVL